MAVGVYHYDSLPTISHATRDTHLDASVSSDSARVIHASLRREGPQTSPSLGSSVNKQRHSKSKTGKPLSKSTSTPHLRGRVMSDSEADKKRNKLGYQRISIACAHCRRRKIRCLIAEGDPQSRCQNCIRLKKECVFYPVDQQTAMENKSQSSGKAGGASSTVSSSPPEMSAGRPFEERRDIGSFHTLPSNAPPGFQNLPMEPGSAIQPQGTFPRPEYGYSQQPGQPWTVPNELDPNASPVQADDSHHFNPNFMRYNPAVSPGDVAPFHPEAMHQPPDVQVAQPFQYQQQSADPYWHPHQGPPPPIRSMSYEQGGHIPGADPYAVAYPPDPSQPYAHMRNMPVSVGIQSPNPMTEGPSSAPGRADHHAFHGQSHQYMIPGDPQGMQDASSRPGYPGQWYPPQFAQMAEDAPGGNPQQYLSYNDGDRSR